MEKEYSFIGKNLTPEEIEDADVCLKRDRAERLRPVEGEIEKTPEQLKFIEKVNSWLNEEFEELGIKEKAEVLPEEIHLLSQKAFKQRFPQSKSDRFFSPMDQVVYSASSVRGVEKNRLALFHAIFHESIHLVSARRYRLHDLNDKEKLVVPYRTGYGTFGFLRGTHEHFKGFDEAVVDKIVLDSLVKHKDEFVREFDIKKHELNLAAPYYYWGNMEILDRIIERIGEKKNENVATVWKRFKKGLFTGEMAHLRDIEKTFGDGALRVVAALGSSTGLGSSTKKTDEKIFKYFMTDSEELRDKIGREVLGEK